MKKIILILFSFLIIFICGIFFAKPAETNLMRAFTISAEDNTIVNLVNFVSNRLNIIFEGNSPEEAERMKSDFPLNENFDNIKEIIDIYRDYPINFITDNSRNLIKSHKYKELREQGYARVYNPLLINISTPDKDPYLFSTEYVLSAINRQDDTVKKFGDKYYAKTTLNINSSDDIKNVIENQKQGIYISGSPIHSYMMAKKSAFEINLICIISTILLFLLCKIYFKSSRIFVFIILSILFGITLGWAVSSIIFKQLHILTFVFSTSLIGISLDYSIHYLMSGQSASFKKNLTVSMLTTVLAFSTLYFSGVCILKQIATFTIFGLLGVYVFVLFILPNLTDSIQTNPLKSIDFFKFRKYILLAFCILFVVGCFRLKFNDDIKLLYNPPKNLIQSEEIYHNVFNPKPLLFLAVKGKNINEILEKEEKLNSEDAIGIFSFISSISKQKENIKLVEELYNKDLDGYAKFLPQSAKTNLKNAECKIYNPEEFPLNGFFKAGENGSYIITSTNIDGAINPSDKISELLKQTRNKCLKQLPFLFLILITFLSFIYGIKQGVKIVCAPLCGALLPIMLFSTFGVSINLFHVIAIFLIIGFGIDYAVFGLNDDSKVSDAILISSGSTAISFLLLSFTSFNVISTLGLILFIGVFFSFIFSKIIR